MKKILIANRGYSEIAPENTKLSFDAACIFKFDGLEIDVHEKDKKIVVICDETIDSTSDGAGYVKNYTYDELLKFNFTHTFDISFDPQKIILYEYF